MNSAYSATAYEKAIFEYLRRYLLDKVNPALKKTGDMVCDELPFASRNIPDNAILGVIQRIMAEEQRLEQDLAKFQHVHETIRPLAKSPENERPSETRVAPEPPARPPVGKPKPGQQNPRPPVGSHLRRVGPGPKDR